MKKILLLLAALGLLLGCQGPPVSVSFVVDEDKACVVIDAPDSLGAAEITLEGNRVFICYQGQ